MSDESRLRVVLCWHMHQPVYQRGPAGPYVLPWTYLHGIKDYVDMAAHLEAVPDARAVVNFAPVLLEQLADYVGQIEGFQRGETAIRDPLLATLAADAPPEAPEERARLIEACLRANETRLVQRFPAYQFLAEWGRQALERPEALAYLSPAYLTDLLVWYHLAWMGETVRRTDARVQALMDRQTGYTRDDCRALLALIGELLAGIVPRYRALQERGQVELSFTPYAHPILPLLIDFETAYEASPELNLGRLEDPYPGGEARVRWHIERGIEVFERYFGVRPTGCWPSEGGLSEGVLHHLAAEGIRWSASGGQMLSNSLLVRGAEHRPGRRCIHHAYRVTGTSPALFFRDDGLSDLVGFNYSDWHADDAVADLVRHLENIAEHCRDCPGAVASIILDGENAWEYYPENGYHFLSALYRKLAAHPRLDLTTFERCLDEDVPLQKLERLVAGSWVYGTFSTWIGDPDKNRGWEMLVDAKRVFDEVQAAGELDAERLAAAERQLAVCEGSDWCWWFGDYNPAESVRDFELLYRQQLSLLYELLDRSPPDYLGRVFAHGHGRPAAGGTMRRGQERG